MLSYDTHISYVKVGQPDYSGADGDDVRSCKTYRTVPQLCCSNCVLSPTKSHINRQVRQEIMIEKLIGVVVISLLSSQVLENTAVYSYIQIFCAL